MHVIFATSFNIFVSLIVYTTIMYSSSIIHLGITSTPIPDLLDELVCSQVSPNWTDFGHHLEVEMSLLKRIERDVKQTPSKPVSYTHLTLPTICSV